MTTEYKVRAFHPSSGDLVGEFSNFEAAAYHRAVNGMGLGEILLPGGHDVIGELVNRAPIEVWRRNQEFDVDWYRDFWGLYLEQDRRYDESESFLMRCPGPLWYLGTRHVLWYAGTTNRTRFVNRPGETIMKTLVDYNAGPNATAANGRQRDGAIGGLSVEADTGAGESKNWYCAWANLLTTLQDLAPIAGGDFDLVPTSSTAWEFRWYTGQLGEVRTTGDDRVTFALEFGNMANPRYRHNRRGEKTVAAIAGQGPGTERDIEIVTSADYAADNDIETFVDAREVDKDDTDSLRDKGLSRLDGERATEEFDFDVLQVASTMYGIHYNLGDLVNARWGGVHTVQKITSITVGITPEGDAIEKIRVEMDTQ